LNNALSQTLQSRIEIFTTGVTQRQRNIQLLLNDPSQIAYAHFALQQPHNEEARRAFKKLMRFRLSDDVRYVALRTPAGKELSVFGVGLASDAIATPLSGSPYSTLVWDGGYLLKFVA